MARPDPLLLETARKLFRAVADPQARRAGDEAAARRAAWQALEDSGLTRAWIAESAGGAGAGMLDGFAILTAAGEVALDLPLAETLLAGWGLAAAGMEIPAGVLVPVPGPVLGPGVALVDGALRGRMRRVAFAREADHLVVCGSRDGNGFVARVDRAACRIEPRDNLASEPRDTVMFDGVAPAALAAAPADLADWLYAMGAVARACQMAGALQAILARSVAYAGERVAFDRPIGKFQAVQHALARLAGEAAAALAASGSAADALAAEAAATAPAVPALSDGTLLEVASAKIRCGEAAAAGAAIAHQVHGAIGFATEHPLHHFTCHLWAWRDDHGSEAEWAVRLGARVAERGADALWPMLAAR